MQNNILFRAGEISAIYPERATARVYLPDLNLVTNEMPIIFQASLKSCAYKMPEISESVLCCFLGNGIESGFILGSYYNSQDKPIKVSKDIWRIDMDGTGFFEFDRLNKEIILKDSYGSFIKFSNGDIIIKAANNIKLN